MPDSSVMLFVGERKEVEIPKGPCIVKTMNSTYKFGRANENGKRSIERLSTNEKHTQPLGFTRCKMLYLALGGHMELLCIDGSANFRLHGWHTSIVHSVSVETENVE